MRGSDWIVVSKFKYYGKWELFELEQLLWWLDVWCDAPWSMTQVGAATVVAMKVHAVKHEGSQSPVVERPAVAVAFVTFHHSFIRL